MWKFLSVVSAGLLLSAFNFCSLLAFWIEMEQFHLVFIFDMSDMGTLHGSEIPFF